MDSVDWLRSLELILHAEVLFVHSRAVKSGLCSKMRTVAIGFVQRCVEVGDHSPRETCTPLFLAFSSLQLFTISTCINLPCSSWAPVSPSSTSLHFLSLRFSLSTEGAVDPLS